MSLFRPNAERLVRKALHARTSPARVKATLALSKLDDEAVVPLTMKALADPATAERAASTLMARSLAGMTDVGLTELVAVLENPHTDPINQLQAAHAVLPFEQAAADRLAVSALASKAGDRFAGMQRTRAIDAMVDIGLDRLRPALTGQALSEGVLQALATCGDLDAGQELERIEQEAAKREAARAQEREAAAQAEEDRRMEAARERETRIGTASLEELIELFTGHDPETIRLAGQTLAQRGASALEPLLAAVDTQMLERLHQSGPWSDDDAKLLIMELTGRQMNMALGDRPLAD